MSLLGGSIKTLDGNDLNEETWLGGYYKYRFTCAECNDEFDRVFNNLKRGNQCLCSKCTLKKRALRKKRTQEEYLEDLKKRDIEIIPMENYITCDTPILHKCPNCNNEQWSVSPSDVLNKHSSKCTKCSTVRKKD